MASIIDILKAGTRASVPLLGRAVKGIAGIGSGAVWNTITRETDYWRNYNAPTQFPSFDDLLHTYYTGLLDKTEFFDGARYNAVNLNNEAKAHSKYDQSYWLAVVSANKPAFDPQTAKQLWLAGRMDDAELYWHCRRGGLADRRMFRQFKGYSEVPDILDTMNLWLRNKLKGDEFIARMRRLGIQDEKTISEYIELATLIPTPSDLIAMAVKDAWDADAVKRFGYDEEFPLEFDEWAQKIGLGGDARTKDQIAAGEPRIGWTNMYWRAHWQTIAPTLAYEFYHRARGNPAIPATWRIPGVEPFTDADLDAVLKINDYPIRFRKYLKAVSFNLISQLRLKAMYAANIIDRNEVNAYYQDNGYNPRDAERLTRMVVVQVAKQQRSKLQVNTLPYVKRAYFAGAADTDQVRVWLLLHKYEDSERYEQIELMNEQDRIALAKEDVDVRRLIAQWDTDEQIQVLEKAIKNVRKAFVRGIINLPTAIANLLQYGVNQIRVSRLVAEWQIDLLSTEREVSAAKVLHWYRIGLIQLAEAQSRLLNLKYSLRDVVILLAEEQRNILFDIANAKLKAAKTEEEKRKALLAQQRAIRQLHDKNRAELARHGSVSQLSKWFMNGVIDEETLDKRLKALDWPTEDIDRLKKEIDIELADKAAKAAKAPPPPAVAKAPKISVERLVKWLKLGLLTEDEFRQRLGDMGYDATDVERYIVEAIGVGAAVAPAEPTGPAP